MKISDKIADEMLIQKWMFLEHSIYSRYTIDRFKIATFPYLFYITTPYSSPWPTRCYTYIPENNSIADILHVEN